MNFHVLHYCSTGDHRTFRNLRIGPSNHYIRKSSSEIWGSSKQVFKQVSTAATPPDPCHSPACHSSPIDMISINRPTITTPPSPPRRGRWTFSMYTGWSARRERVIQKEDVWLRQKKKGQGEKERYWTNFLTTVRCNPQE